MVEWSQWVFTILISGPKRLSWLLKWKPTHCSPNLREIESEIRRGIVSGLGIAARTVILKPPKWIVKSTAGKPARSTTREKLLLEHPELRYEHQEV